MCLRLHISDPKATPTFHLCGAPGNAANPEGITGEDLYNFIDTELFPALKRGLQMDRQPNNRSRVVRDVFIYQRMPTTT